MSKKKRGRGRWAPGPIFGHKAAGAGVGIGTIFGHYVAGGIRNPAGAPRMFGNVLLGFALTEAVALYALVMAFLILFG